MILQLLMAFGASVGFCFVFNVPRSEMLYGGVCAAIGWGCYELLVAAQAPEVFATFITTILMAMICRYLSYLRKVPVTIFLIASIVLLVPGAGIYATMYAVITDDSVMAALKGTETMKIAGVIAIGIMIALSLPPKFFTVWLPKKAAPQDL